MQLTLVVQTACDSSSFVLCLYVAGQTPKCMRAFSNLKRICEQCLTNPLPHRDDRPAGQTGISARRSDSGGAYLGASHA
jgi:hypothetical protein